MQLPKGYIKASFIILLTITAVLLYRDITNRLGPTPKPPVEKRKMPEEKISDEREEDEAPDQTPAETVTGRVMQYGNNRIGDIDKILLQTSNAAVWMHFPPHTASRILEIALKNTEVRATVEGNGPDDESIKELLSLENIQLGKKIIIDAIPPPAPSEGLSTDISGSSIKFQMDDHGHAAGFILSGKLVELKPKAAETLIPLLQQAKSIAVKGMARSTQAGFVNSNGLILVKPISITIDNVNYIVQ